MPSFSNATHLILHDGDSLDITSSQHRDDPVLADIVFIEIWLENGSIAISGTPDNLTKFLAAIAATLDQTVTAEASAERVDTSGA